MKASDTPTPPRGERETPTPRTDANEFRTDVVFNVHRGVVPADFARTLERESDRRMTLALNSAEEAGKMELELSALRSSNGQLEGRVAEIDSLLREAINSVTEGGIKRGIRLAREKLQSLISK